MRQGAHPMDTYALTRLQSTKGAWYWAVNFRRRGSLHSGRFYDTAYGGDALAHRAARAWRDEQLAAVATLGKLEFCQQKRSNNTSAVPGVHFLTSVKQPLGFWQARLKLAGQRPIHKSFSVRAHGNKLAYQMAVAARMEMLARQQDEPYLYSTVAKRKAPAAAQAGR